MTTITLRDDQWARIVAFLRTCPHVRVGKEDDCRRFVEGVLWMSRSGAQWRLVPREYGKWNSLYKRFGRWCEQGVWTAMLAHFAEEPDMENVRVDSTVIRAHPCAAGALKKTVDKPRKAWGVRGVASAPKSMSVSRDWAIRCA